jgi:Glycosyltransferase family 87
VSGTTPNGNTDPTGTRSFRPVTTVLHNLSIGFCVVSVAFYFARLWTIYAAGELFHRLGFDWSLFYAQAITLRLGAAAQMYDLAALDKWLKWFQQYYSPSAKVPFALQAPYPPWFAAIFEIFTLPPAPVAFALWTVLSVACGCLLAIRIRTFFPELHWWSAIAIVFAAYSVAWGLFLGQVGMLIAVAVSEMFISFRARRDLRAGLWLSVLMLKPQYALVFGLLLVWKWRARAIVGALIGSAVFVLVGVIGAGVGAFVQFAAVLGQSADFRNEQANPWGMINWRALVLYVFPDIRSDQGAALVTALSAATIAVVLYFWRDRWDPQSSKFAPRFAVLAFAAVITSYHSHPHGAPLLFVPVAAAWSQNAFSLRTRLAILAAFYVPTAIMIWVAGFQEHLAVSSNLDVPLWTMWPDAFSALLFVTAFLLMLRDVWLLHAPSNKAVTIRGKGVAPAGVRG